MDTILTEGLRARLAAGGHIGLNGTLTVTIEVRSVPNSSRSVAAVARQLAALTGGSSRERLLEADPQLFAALLAARLTAGQLRTPPKIEHSASPLVASVPVWVGTLVGGLAIILVAIALLRRHRAVRGAAKRTRIESVPKRSPDEAQAEGPEASGPSAVGQAPRGAAALENELPAPPGTSSLLPHARQAQLEGCLSDHDRALAATCIQNWVPGQMWTPPESCVDCDIGGEGGSFEDQHPGLHDPAGAEMTAIVPVHTGDSFGSTLS
mmetsp:Transcript_97888/g.277442  ORF Transcript_97888/g.277442 Transcript_97888/m.277442 type:complete len:266 (-) Transcript_97888:187-984(-)